ncbi:MAG: selenocysteine-specific translation elongation factor [Chloroflexi bacterium]|nr:selenocysteine-specific translation elongation factor [Chloroflexota bacterium]
MRVIGTAGHVDHGKSTLVEALTGTHPDRLKEEREREMTIDLGFAWFTLPDGEEVGVVDVPGHRDFIENMLAGVGGIDAALFVIAADEGVMPQTREHLAILDLLQIQGGVVALTKIDMVEDADWLALVEEDVRQALANTVLAEAPILRVSARKRVGLEGLRAALSACLAERPLRPDLGRPRLPVDRIFTVAGFGTVVTGTLSDGSLHVGDDVEVLPGGRRGRVRGLQSHKRKEETAAPGSRTAVNISGVAVDEIQRGDVIARPGSYRPTARMDVRFRLLPDASQPLTHNLQAKLYLGAAEIVARVRLLGVEALQPGEEGWLQLELSQPAAAVRGDRYILRRPSPGETLGGGAVVDPHPRGRHKRFAAETLARLEALERGTPDEVLLQALTILGAAPLKDALARASLDAAAAEAALTSLRKQGQLILLEEGGGRDALATTPGAWQQLSRKAVHEMESYHRAYPLRRGMPREELKSRLKLTPRLFSAAAQRLVKEGVMQEAGPLVLLNGWQIQFNPQQKQAAEGLLRRFAAAGYAPPSVKECAAEAGDDLYAALIEMGQLVQVSSEVVFSRGGYERMVAEVRGLIEKQGSLTAAQARDHFNTSRRYVLALLEHLDAIGVTLRDGDARRLRRG